MSQVTAQTYTPVSDFRSSDRVLAVREGRLVKVLGQGVNTSATEQAKAVTYAGGTTANRPADPDVFHTYFDSTLGIPIWYNGTDWVDAAGTTV